MANNIQNAYSQLMQQAQKRAKAQHDPSLKYVPQQYKDVAAGMEKQFAQFMVEQMNKTTGASDGNSTGSQYYKSLQTNERAEMLTKNNGGLGLQKMILDQVYPQRLRNKFAYKQYQAQQNQQRIVKPKFEMHSVPTEEQITMHRPQAKGVSHE